MGLMLGCIERVGHPHAHAGSKDQLLTWRQTVAVLSSAELQPEPSGQPSAIKEYVRQKSNGS